MKEINKKRLKRVGTIGLNALYLAGIFASIKQGYLILYLLITTTLMILIWRKPLWQIMKVGGELYAAFCWSKSAKILKKVDKKNSQYYTAVKNEN